MRVWKLLAVVSFALILGLAAHAQKNSKAQRPTPNAPPRKVEFLRDVAPILDRSGCSTAGCHGKFGGRGGFQLSLLTLAPEDDYDPMVYADRGRRINFADPAKSLLLLKATGSIPHGGGPRFGVNSPEYATILSWLKAGAPFPESDPRLATLTISPKKTQLPKVGSAQPLKVIATYTDGTRRDVTNQSVYESTNDAVISVSQDGSAVGKRWGGGAVIARYLGSVTAAFFTLPQTLKGKYPPQVTANVVDRFVTSNLKTLNVIPSRPATDYELVRRLYLDVGGRLPTPEETTTFVSDSAKDKRAKLIDKLLDSPDFVDFRTLRLADLLRVHPRKLGNNQLAERAAAIFYEWIWKGVEENKRWDQFVREIVTATGSTYQSGPANFYRIERSANDRMETVGQAFMGVRMSCARCHKHPFDRWNTDDYWNFAAFCAKMQIRGGKLVDENVIYYNHGAEVRNQSVTGRNKGKVAPATYLGEKSPAQPAENVVVAFADWLVSPQNPFFARATVNRLWSYYFGRGIVHPVDDMRETTPESVPGLLDALAKELVSSGFNVKHVTKLLLNSKTYQLSAVPNESNRLDDRFFARYYAKPMPAEVLLDMINTASGTNEQLGTWPERSRAIQASLPPQNYFLSVFGQSHREFLADIDPKLEPNLVQTLTMINSPYIEGKVRGGQTLDTVLKETKTDEELVQALFLRTLNRPPSKPELQKCLAILRVTPSAADPNAKPPNPEARRRDLAQDLLWALITAREFYFNH